MFLKLFDEQNMKNLQQENTQNKETKSLCGSLGSGEGRYPKRGTWVTFLHEEETAGAAAGKDSLYGRFINCLGRGVCCTTKLISLTLVLIRVHIYTKILALH